MLPGCQGHLCSSLRLPQGPRSSPHPPNVALTHQFSPFPPPSHPPTAPASLFGGPCRGHGAGSGVTLKATEAKQALEVRRVQSSALGPTSCMVPTTPTPLLCWRGREMGPGKAGPEDFQGSQRWREGICSSAETEGKSEEDHTKSGPG